MRVHCIYQFAKTNFTHEQLREIDEELETPTGRPLPHEIPKIVIEEYLLYSPDCSKVLSLKPEVCFPAKDRSHSSTNEKCVNWYIGVGRVSVIFGIASD